MPSSLTLTYAQQRLTASGLGHLTPLELSLDILDAEETAAINPAFPSAPAIRINYLDPWASAAGMPLKHKGVFPKFQRIRLIGPDVMGRDGKPLRYLQPAGQGVAAYFARGVDWPTILKDAQHDLFFTEGEFKATKACAMGFPTIGLGGVFNVSSRKTGCEFLPELERIEWVGRRVFIAFDNDGKPNPNVLLAINRFATRCEELGATPYFVRLPDPAPGKKMGLDDYFLDHTADEFRTLLAGAESMGLARRLWEMNRIMVKVREPMCVIDARDGVMMKPDSFKAHYSNQRVEEQLLNKDGVMSQKLVPLAEHWLRWPLRTSVDRLLYEPGRESFMDGAFNVWRGWGVPSVKGDVTPFKQLLTILFGDTTEGKQAMRWWLQWAAYPIQHPGTKMYTAALLWGRQHGTGKTLLAYVMRDVYGRPNVTEVNQKQLHAAFNTWVENRAFVIGDEITGSDNRVVSDQIKSLITQESVWVNKKHIAEYELRNVANLMFTSNKASALYIEDEDRRYFVWEVLGKGTLGFYQMFDKWYKDPDNIGHVRHFLESVDLTGFDPFAPAMETTCKRNMIEDTRSATANWCHKLKSDPDHLLRVGKVPIDCDLFSSEELLALFQREGPTTTKAGTLGIELRAVGFTRLEQLRWGSPTRTSRFFIIRNEQKWLKAKPAQIRAYVENHKGGGK